jgi:hypothetical protein
MNWILLIRPRSTRCFRAAKYPRDLWTKCEVHHAVSPRIGGETRCLHQLRSATCRLARDRLTSIFDGGVFVSRG